MIALRLAKKNNLRRKTTNQSFIESSQSLPIMTLEKKISNINPHLSSKNTSAVLSKKYQTELKQKFK